MNDIYRELILDLYRNPVNKHVLDPCTHQDRGYNPQCGDDLQVYLYLEGETITATSYTGTGCALSIAAASLLSQEIQGKTIQEVRNMTRQEIYDIVGLEYDPTRFKCVTLYITTVQQIVADNS